MKKPRILKFYKELSEGGYATVNQVTRFAEKVSDTYTEGTLVRLLQHQDKRIRAAALIALRFVGGMTASPEVAHLLYDGDEQIREVAEGTLWSLWFRGESADDAQELQRLAQLIVEEQYPQALSGLNKLIKRSPHYAEAYNQRAILNWRRNKFKHALADCKKVLELNPFHFGAQAGMAQCYLEMKNPLKALESFRRALQINPNLKGVQENIQVLEELLDDEEEAPENEA